MDDVKIRYPMGVETVISVSGPFPVVYSLFQERAKIDSFSSRLNWRRS